MTTRSRIEVVHLALDSYERSSVARRHVILGRLQGLVWFSGIASVSTVGLFSEAPTYLEKAAPLLPGFLKLITNLIKFPALRPTPFAPPPHPHPQLTESLFFRASLPSPPRDRLSRCRYRVTAILFFSYLTLKNKKFVKSKTHL